MPYTFYAYNTTPPPDIAKLQWHGAMWWVLIEKTSGDALLRVRTVESGDGKEAYRRRRNWYGKQTDMGLAELRQRVIRPVQAKRE